MSFKKCWISVCQFAVATGVTLTMLLATTAVVNAQTVTLAWDANTEPNLGGYIVHSGTQSGSYSSKVDAGARTSLPISGLDATKNYYFAVQAYNADGMLSGLSQEVTLPAEVAAIPTTITSVTASVAMPLLVGTPVTWTTIASSTSGPVEYKFLLYTQQGGWRVAQNYSAAATFTWVPSWSDLGTAAVQVWVRTVGSTAPYEAWRGLDPFDVNAVPASLTADTDLPSPMGQPIVWTASVTGAAASLEYKYLLMDPTRGGWVVLRDYTADRQITWTPSHNGTYAIQVWARRIGSTLAYENWTTSGEFQITPTRLAVTRLDVDQTFPVQTGTAITWTARTRGGMAGPLQFKFLEYSSRTGGWRVVQDYSTSRSYNWRPTWGDEGSHVLQVWVRNAGSTAGYDAWLATDTFEISRAQLQLTTDTVFPAAPSARVTWTAEVADASLNLEYAFLLYDRSNGTWSVGRAYGPSNTFTWTPGVAGTYAVQAWARRVGSTAGYDAWRGTEYLEILNSPAKLKSVTPSAAFPAPQGTPITWTAIASGGNATLEYRFVIYNASTGWRVLRDYGASRSVNWTPGPQDAGSNALQVWVRSTGSSAAYEDWIATPYFTVRP